ncbi:hypothetical protein [Parasitella parasitica]|uniref:Uncharacterized protein n=1 Tax=Parasitella parasitica TaxID=35722 RepID=A0A0B7NGG5_9FUNG|nr:hypothetical protein [Parasitella parasitica]
MQYQPSYNNSSNYQEAGAHAQNDLIKLIDVEAPAQVSRCPEVIHISLAEITGGYIDPVKAQQRSQRLLQVINYIDKCNEKHTQLMNQVANVRLYYQRTMYP